MSTIGNLFDQTLAALSTAGAKFVVVGGFATILQGVGRSTSDLDLVIDLAESNVRTIISVLQSLGFQCRLPVNPLDFARPDIREEWVRKKNLQVMTFYHIRYPAFAVDIFAQPPIPHHELSNRATMRGMGKLTVPIAAVEDLISMKQLSGRPQDLADIAALQDVLDRKTHEPRS